MQLEGRKLRILNIIIESYMKTGEPVGSRTISKDPNIGISPATVRNEMADLEELGYIMQPHTSAGRIPTDLGYRLYVDQLLDSRYKYIKDKEEELKNKEIELDSRFRLLDEKYDKLENMLHTIAVSLADNTNYTTLVTGLNTKMKIKFMQLSMLDDYKLILVCVTAGNVIRNQIIETGYRLDDSSLLKLNLLLNTYFTNKYIDKSEIEKLLDLSSKNNKDIILLIIEALKKMFYDDEDLEIYTAGTTNVLKYPELSQENSLEGLLTEIVEKNELANFINKTSMSDTDIKIYIGDESNLSHMKNCSVITMNFEVKNGFRSTIGIIGPKRMDYQRVLDNLNSVKIKLLDVFDDEE